MRIAYAGGGTGGHVIPLIAVAEEMRRRGHDAVFFGTARGIEMRLVPAAGFPLELIEIGGLKGLGLMTRLRTLAQLPVATAAVVRAFAKRDPAAVFSLGGYAAAPVVIAALIRGMPVVAMEPNAMPGVVNRWLGGFLTRVLAGFDETARYFPRGRTEVTGLPVRDAFFDVAPVRTDGPLRVLITGGSRGSRTLNAAFAEAWPRLRADGIAVTLQGGREAPAIEGADVVDFIAEMPAAYAAADLIVSRSGAGAVAEIAAAGRPSLLVPFPFAADDHQTRNAEVLVRAGAARVVADRELTGDRLYREICSLAADRPHLERMGESARVLAKRGAAARAADILEETAKRD